MSTCLELVCRTCKKSFTVGQWNDIWFRDEQAMLNLNDFLQTHKTRPTEEHCLLFVDHHWDEQYEDGWELVKYKVIPAPIVD